MTLRPGILRQPADEKGQPEGYAVTGTTRKPRVAEEDPVSYDAAGQLAEDLTREGLKATFKPPPCAQKFAQTINRVSGKAPITRGY
jgi:hypothetical protein